MNSLPKIIIEHSDDNVNIAIRVGVSSSFPGPQLPQSLASDIHQRAEIIRRFNEELNMANFKNNLGEENTKKEILLKIIEWVKKVMPYPKLTDKERIALVLRLWSGCISAAKLLSDKDNNGPIDSKYRSEGFQSIDEYSKEDQLFSAGVECAQEYRKIGNEPIFLEGVPKNSVVRF